jgi:cyanate lyase
MKTVQQEIGDRLAQAMKAADMDVAELARLTTIEPELIEGWLVGRGMIPVPEIKKLCHTLDLMPGKLLFG